MKAPFLEKVDKIIVNLQLCPHTTSYVQQSLGDLNICPAHPLASLESVCLAHDWTISLLTAASQKVQSSMVVSQLST